MKTRTLICLILALTLAFLCFAGCRSTKEEPKAPEPEEIQTEEQQPEEQQPEEQQPEEKEPEVVVVPPPGQAGLEVDDEELVIEIPEDSELFGD